jgi:hypothetical protein
MDIQQLLTTDYDTLPMGVRHRILGEASYYLDKVIETGTIPGIKGYHIFPVMNSWCEVNADYIEACLAGIWYMGKTGMTTGLHNDRGYNALSYLDRVRYEDISALHPLVGLDNVLPQPNEYRPWWACDVQSRLYMLRQHLPTMDSKYRALGG